MNKRSVKGCGETYEYEPQGVFGVGHGSPLGPSSKAAKAKPLGLQHAMKRANAKARKKK